MWVIVSLSEHCLFLDKGRYFFHGAHRGKNKKE